MNRNFSFTQKALKKENKILNKIINKNKNERMEKKQF
jgi:hypothetical protein